MHKRVVPHLALPALALASAAAAAIPPIPEESGWSGHVGLGIGAASSETNMVDGLSSFDLGQEKISSLDDSPGSEDLALPTINFEVAYTLADSRTQFHLGNHMADYITFDQDTSIETHLGIRQAVAEVGRFGVALVTSPMATDVWKDPYLVGEKRGDTERSSFGLTVGWDEVLGTPLAIDWTAKEIDLDDEDSGKSLSLSAAEQKLLKRTGNVYRVNASYRFVVSPHHTLVPRIGYVDFDLDGGAMEQDGIALGLDYEYQRDRWRFLGKLSYQGLESSSRNPIFGDKREVDTTAVSATLVYDKPFGWQDWAATATAAYTDGDANIDFYESSFGMVSIGMLYRFD